MTTLDLLPDDCLSNILSFASPYEACCLALVSQRSCPQPIRITCGPVSCPLIIHRFYLQ
uniref:Cysteine-rich mini protein n=1 Tax=Viola baoshanensis TaxID=349688 RepID=A5YRZ2_9ROSI|nr:cysteine-rich mini protein [Viola baoshanensis]